VERLRPTHTGMVPRPGARCSPDPSGLFPDPDGVASDLIVRESHSIQAIPTTIVDVRSIVYLHPKE